MIQNSGDRTLSALLLQGEARGSSYSRFHCQPWHTTAAIDPRGGNAISSSDVWLLPLAQDGAR